MRIDLILLLFNRPEHTKNVLEGLKRNGIKNLRAYLDFSSKPADLIKQNKILKIINNFDGINIDLIQRKENFGLAKSVTKSLDEVFDDGAEAAVLLEDDCVLIENGFSFFEQGLHQLKDNKQIRSLCGYTFPSRNLVFDYDSDILLLSRFSSWGWGTWADRWVQYEGDYKKVIQLIDSIHLKIEDFAPDIDIVRKSPKYLNGEADVWSINWILLHYITSTFAVFPRESVISNIGLDGSGVNCENTDVFITTNKRISENIYKFDKLQYFPENENTIRKFMAEHGLKTYSV